MRKKILLLSAFFILALAICLLVMRLRAKDSLDVNVSDIELSIKVERFDRDLADVFIKHSSQEVLELNSKYSDFFNSFNENVIGVNGGIDNSSYEIYLRTFLTDYSVVEANKEVQKVFPDLKSLENELSNGFKHLLYYYPEFEVPRIVSFVAGFNQSIIVMDKFIGIGLDKYLGADCPIYDMLNIPEFAKNEMLPSQVSIDLMMALFESEHPFVAQSNNLLENMIYNGMKLYFLRAMFPKFDIARINKYSKEDLLFCEENEKGMWMYLIEHKLLFETNSLTIRKLVAPAPFTNQFGPESPARTANWLGLRIVESFVKKNDISFQDLLKITDYQYILNKSGYNPK